MLGREVIVFALIFLAAMLLKGAVLGGLMVLDPDLGWHLAYGAEILKTHVLPSNDAWSASKFSQAYQLTQWGGETLLALAHSYGGDTALIGLTCLVCTVVACCVYASVRPLLQTGSMAATVTLACTLSLWASTARPTLFGTMLLSILVLTMTNAIRTGRCSHPAMLGLPLVFALWSNMHASFPVGLAALVVCCTYLFIMHSVARCHGQAAMALVLVLVCAAATLLNPYGATVWEPVFAVAKLKSTSAVISEWAPTAPFAGGGAALAPVLALVVVALRRPSSNAAVVGMSLAMALGLQAVRMVPLACVLAAPLIAQGLCGGAGDQLREHRGIGSMTRTAFVGWLVVSLLGCAAAFAVMLGTGTASKAEIESHMYPVRAALFLEANGVVSPVWGEMEHGGWWIARGRRVFMDGRLDLYGDEGYFDHQATRNGRPGWEQRLAKDDPNIVVLNNSAPLRQLLLARSRYALAQDDGQHSIFLKMGVGLDDLLSEQAGAR